MDVRDELLAVSDEASQRTATRLEGLTDDEYRWEPAPDCWTVSARPDGELRADWSVDPESPPFTTIAWRLWHLVSCYGGERNELLLRGEAGPGGDERGAPRATAAEALAALGAAQAWWRALVASLSEDELAAALGPVAGQYADYTRAAFVLHQIDEQIHHGAEVGLLRDLHRATGSTLGTAPGTLVQRVLGGQRPADAELDALRAERPDFLRWAAANGYWRAVPVLVEAGFAVDAEERQVTALHNAAAAGEVAIVRLLLDHGADPTRQDDMFHATPAGWGAFFGARRVVEVLRG